MKFILAALSIVLNCRSASLLCCLPSAVSGVANNVIVTSLVVKVVNLAGDLLSNQMDENEF